MSAELAFRMGLRSLEREIVEPVELAVEGQIPAELRGTLYRMGPARWDIYGDRLRHWFDGDGMVHALEVHGGGVRYRCRFVQQSAHVAEDRARRRLFGSFGTSAPGGRLRRFLWRKRRRNPANTHVIAHAGGLYALCEGGRPWRLDPADLATLGEETLGGLLPEPITTFTAHPRRDPATGDLWGFGVQFGRVPRLHLYRWPGAGAATKAAIVDLPMPALIHDFGLSERYAVVVATPMVVPTIPFALMFGQSSYAENLSYRPERGAQVGLIDRASGEAIWCPTEPFLAFHVVNAYDEGDEVVVDVCAYRSPALLEVFYAVMAGPMPTVDAEIWRLRVDRRSRAVRREVLLPRSFEFPRVLDERVGRRHRWIAGLTWQGAAAIPRVPAMVDVDTGTMIEAPLPAEAWAGELVPVRKVGGEGERDVWLLSVVLDTRAGASELQIFDGAALEAGPIARARLPHVMPLGFHGSWVADGTL